MGEVATEGDMEVINIPVNLVDILEQDFDQDLVVLMVNTTGLVVPKVPLVTVASINSDQVAQVNLAELVRINLAELAQINLAEVVPMAVSKDRFTTQKTKILQ
jgi:hypothetical protein